MRSTIRLLAAVQRNTQFLEAGAPTGLTGLATHATPRTTLLYLYSSTLEKLKQFPEHSAYRQSAEALTKHRMKIIESTKPAELGAWQQRVAAQLEAHPQAFRKIPLSSGASSNEFNIIWKQGTASAVSRPRLPAFGEGPWTEKDLDTAERLVKRANEVESLEVPPIEPEPALTTDQINDIETKMASGLIEEIIQVAEGESALASALLENKVWEDLEEKPVEGQWVYHERDRHTAGTEA